VRAILASHPEARERGAEIIATARACLSDAPHPVAQIVSQGRLKSDPERIASHVSLQDMEKISALAGAWVADPKAEYAAQARAFVLAWARECKSTGDAINDTKLEPMFWAIDWLAPSFNPQEREAVNAWLRATLDIELTAHALPPTRYNNTFSHRLKTIGLCALLLKDEARIAQVAQLFEAQIGANLNADGSSFDLHERDALHYHCYTLEPLLTLALAFRSHGRDFYHYTSPEGSSLEKSVRYLIPFCDGSRQHPEYVNSKNAFDRQRGEAGESGFIAGHAFPPKEGLHALELASAFDATLIPLVARLAEHEGTTFPTWQTVLNAAGTSSIEDGSRKR
jgi:hypothetical protein